MKHIVLVVLLTGCSGIVGDELAPDAGAPDAAGTDAGAPDGGASDGGLDAGQPDAGQPDAGVDGGAPDAGGADAGCPLAPPFDLDAPGMSACTTPVLIAVGNRTRRAVSFDGQTWLDDQLDDGNCVNGTCFDDGAFQAAFGLGYIVTASDFGIFTSADRGHTWVKAPAPAPQKWGEGVHVSDVVWTGKNFVIFSEQTAFTSSDGLSWQKHAIALAGDHLAFGAVTVGQRGRVLATQNSTSINVSDDHGVTWKTVAAGASFKSLASNGALMVGVGNAVRGVSTDNGDHWTIFADDCTLNEPSRCVGSASMVLFHDGKFVFTGSNAVLESTNGTTWSKVGTGTGFDWVHVFFNGQDVGVGYPGTSYHTGPNAGGPWATHTWPGAITEGMLGLSTGRVLKR
jgi:predicted secreted protein